MLTYEEAQAKRAEFTQAITDARTNEVAPACPLTREGCEGRSCACAMRVDVGWICGLTHSRSKARARVADVDADALAKSENRLIALTYMERGRLYA